jgi:flagellar protein FliO/FliZ
MATDAHTGMFAAPQVTAPVHPSAIGGLGEVALALLLVLAAIFVIAWLLRKMRIVGNRVGGAIDVLANVQLGQKERAVLLKVGSTQILVGVAPGQVSTLHVLTEPLEITRPPAATSGDATNTFRDMLMRSLGK